MAKYSISGKSTLGRYTIHRSNKSAAMQTAKRHKRIGNKGVRVRKLKG